MDIFLKIRSFSQKGERVESNEYNKRRKSKIKCFYCKKSGHMIKDCKIKIANEKQNKESKESQSNITTKKTSVMLFAISLLASSSRQNDIRYVDFGVS